MMGRISAVILFLVASASWSLGKLVFKSDGTFKILHISDVHYEIPALPFSCDDINLNENPCDNTNSTAFLSWLIETEKPDLVVHTGDIIDWATYPASQGMTEYYNVSYAHNVAWTASLGNHDDDSKSMLSREKVIDYVVGLPGTLTVKGQVAHTFGNYYLEIFASAADTAPSFRTYHLDADTNGVGITAEQVQWFDALAADLAAKAKTPALAFFHVPLREYQSAMDEGIAYTGGYNEAICCEESNTGMFQALLKAGDVKATFVGHDHTNNFCVPYQGIQLCYEGSPGFQAYGRAGYPRRARVTELRSFGSEVVSWKRLDTSIGGGLQEDEQTLWAAQPGDSSVPAHRAAVPKVASPEFIQALPRRETKH